MASTVDIHSVESDYYVLARVPEGILHAAGRNVPADGKPGFAIGCLFQKLNGAAGSTAFFNEGSALSCDFDAASVA